MDRISTEQRSKNMRNIRSKDTSIELKLRKALWNKGIRYRKNYKKIPGKPDIAITKYKIAIFCDSSFFHGRDYENMKKPETNKDFWENKIKRNIERDDEVNKQLFLLGWIVLRFWDVEINKELDECVRTIIDVINDNKLKMIEKELGGNI